MATIDLSFTVDIVNKLAERLETENPIALKTQFVELSGTIEAKGSLKFKEVPVDLARKLKVVLSAGIFFCNVWLHSHPDDNKTKDMLMIFDFCYNAIKIK